MSQSTIQQVFWSVTGITADSSGVDDGDFGSDVTDAITNAVDSVFDSDLQFSVSFVGGRNINLPPTISFTFTSDQAITAGEELDKLTKDITTALQSKSVLGNQIAAIVQNSTRFIQMNDAAANMVSSATVSDAHARATIAINKYVNEALKQETKAVKLDSNPLGSLLSSDTPTSFTNFRDVPYKDVVEGFSVNATLSNLFLNAEGQDLNDLIHTLFVTFRQISTETKTSAIVTLMLSAGIVTIGSAMWDAYEQLASSDTTLALLVPKLITAAGGATVINPIAALLSSVLSIASLREQSAKNVLLTINSSNTAFYFNGDAIGNGERDVASYAIPPSGGIKLAFPCATYGYGKYTTPTDTGPWVGFSLTTDNEWFSVGMNCTNTVFGNPNSVRLLRNGNSVEDDTQKVANNAKDWTNTTTTRQTIIIKNQNKQRISCIGKRSALWGNTNFGLCFLSDVK